MDISLNQLIQVYLNSTLNLRPLTTRITLCYTLYPQNGDLITFIDYVTSFHHVYTCIVGVAARPSRSRCRIYRGTEWMIARRINNDLLLIAVVPWMIDLSSTSLCWTPIMNCCAFAGEQRRGRASPGSMGRLHARLDRFVNRAVTFEHLTCTSKCTL